MNEKLLTLASKLILASTTGDQSTIDDIKNELTTALTNQKGNGEQTSPCDFYLDNVGFLKFTNQEILKMPKQFRKTFRLQGKTVHYRIRKDGRYKKSYEIRYAKKPFNKNPLSVSAGTLDEVKARFIEKLNNYTPLDDTTPTVPKDFHGFSLYWFENFHKRKVAERTYDHDIKLYNRHIKEYFGRFKIKDINAVSLQNFLDKFSDRGKTAKDLYSTLNQIFSCAVKHGLIKLNPLGIVIIDNYEQEHGTLITKNDEQKLFEAYKGTEWEMPFAIVIYCGLRPCEYTSATIDGEFIKVQNHKRKGGIIEYKRIPITPMLRPYLQEITEINMPKPRMLNNRFKKVLPHHQLYDMRTTFQTRCTECKINETLIGLWMGNSIGKLKGAYTDFSKEFILSEAEKFKY